MNQRISQISIFIINFKIHSTNNQIVWLFLISRALVRDPYRNAWGDKQQTLLLAQSLAVAPKPARQPEDRDAGLRLDWATNASRYVAHVEQRPPQSPTA